MCVNWLIVEGGFGGKKFDDYSMECVLNIVFMGMGELFVNYKCVMDVVCIMVVL